jgi:hypothetical protein
MFPIQPQNWRFAFFGCPSLKDFMFKQPFACSRMPFLQHAVEDAKAEVIAAFDTSHQRPHFSA